MVEITVINKEMQPLKVKNYISAFKEVYGTPNPDKLKIGDYIRAFEQGKKQKFFEIVGITLNEKGLNYNIKDNDTGAQYLLSLNQLTILEKIAN